MIRAPFSGWVSLRTISVGAIASQGTEIATISDLTMIKLDFTVPETMLAAIRDGPADPGARRRLSRPAVQRRRSTRSTR